MEITEDLCRLGDALCILGGPELLMLLASEALVVVPFTLKELLEVWFAVKLPLQRCIGPQTTEQRSQEITSI